MDFYDLLEKLHCTVFRIVGKDTRELLTVVHAVLKAIGTLEYGVTSKLHNCTLQAFSRYYVLASHIRSAFKFYT